MIDFDVDASAATLKLKSIVPKARGAASAVMADTAAALSGSIRQNIAAAGLRDVDGTLAGSIRVSVTDDDDGTEARVFTDPSVAYARIQEYGGRISVPEIAPDHAKVLAFRYEGKLVFAEHVRAHDVTVPASNYTEVNDNPPLGAGSYVSDTNVGDADLYGFPALSASATNIQTVAVKAYCERSDAGARTVNLNTKSSGTTAQGSSSGITPPSGFGWISSYFDTDPNTSAAWASAAAVNAATSGLSIAS